VSALAERISALFARGADADKTAARDAFFELQQALAPNPMRRRRRAGASTPG
jgi:hypothetical protein